MEYEITTDTYTPKELTEGITAIFPDSQGLPIEGVEFEGSGVNKWKNGNSTKGTFYNFGHQKFFVSEWANIPLALKKGDKCTIYVNEKGKVEVLKLE